LLDNIKYFFIYCINFFSQYKALSNVFHLFIVLIFFSQCKASCVVS